MTLSPCIATEQLHVHIITHIHTSSIHDLAHASVRECIDNHCSEHCLSCMPHTQSIRWPSLHFLIAGGGETPIHTKVILSSHNFDDTPPDAALDDILEQMWKQGADVAKIATTATDITDCARILTLLKTSQGMAVLLLHSCAKSVSSCVLLTPAPAAFCITTKLKLHPGGINVRSWIWCCHSQYRQAIQESVQGMFNMQA